MNATISTVTIQPLPSLRALLEVLRCHHRSRRLCHLGSMDDPDNLALACFYFSCRKADEFIAPDPDSVVEVALFYLR